nr:hypothetical protein [Tanacetum cinerariifolium]
GLDIPSCQMLESHGLIPMIPPAQALKSVHDMVDHSQNLDSLGCDMQKLKEIIHAIHVGHLREHEYEAHYFRTLEGLKKVKISRPLICVVKKMPEYLNNALVDLGASINIMLFSMSKMLNMRNLQPTNMIVEMTDMTKKAPRGIIENVLVQINKFIFPVDFVIIYMVEDPEAPLILGRPHLETVHERIDFFNKKIH